MTSWTTKWYFSAGTGYCVTVSYGDFDIEQAQRVATFQRASLFWEGNTLILMIGLTRIEVQDTQLAIRRLHSAALYKCRLACFLANIPVSNSEVVSMALESLHGEDGWQLVPVYLSEMHRIPELQSFSCVSSRFSLSASST